MKVKWMWRLASAILCVIAPVVGWSQALEDESEVLARAVAANQAQDFATSVGIYRHLADNGSAAGAGMLGLMYWGGHGVPRDHTRACDWFEQAERRGDPSGTELLGDCFFHGVGRPQDYVQSAKLYERASSRGMPMADCALGNQYLLGQGVARDPPRAFSLCKNSADRGDANAETDLAQMYLTGVGAQRNPEDAVRWLRKAVDQGQSNASLLLGKMLWNGDGVERNHDEAARTWLIAARAGNPAAPALLAKYYFVAAMASAKDHIVVTEPATQAAYWATQAVRLDPDPAVRADSQKLADDIYSVAPQLKAKIDTLLANPK